MYKRIILFQCMAFLFCVCCYQQSKAQDYNNTNHSLNNVIPPAPNASAINKFGDVPVGYSTGIPQIGVPIYSYKNSTGNLGLSIGLSYHAGGIRVDEVASDVGIGWALSAGGVISRTLRGIPDEIPDYGFINAAAIPNNEVDGNSNNGSISQFREIDAGVRDGQSDIFNFSCGSVSGKFMLGKNNDFLMLTSNRVKVEKVIENVAGMPTNPVISKFILTDEKGVKYIFDAIETTLTPGAVWTSSKQFVSSWYLTKIIAPSATDEIIFTYETVNYEYQTGRSASSTIGLNYEWYVFPSRPESRSVAAQSIAGKRIKTITFPNGVVADFTYDATAREDIPHPTSSLGLYRLKKITISEGGRQQGYNLYHDYSLNRLTLLRAVPFNQFSNENKGYSFEYYRLNGQSTAPLPDRLSYEQDHWGFYNTGGGLIPQEYFVDGQDGINARLLPGANKEVDVERVKYGSLQKIFYPTGGYTQFEMEANKAEDSRLRRTFYLRTAPEVTQDKYIYVQSNATSSEAFTINPDANTNTNFDVSYNWGSYQCPGTCKMVVEIWNSSNQVLSSHDIPVIDNQTSIQGTFAKYNMTPGTYTFKIYITSVQGYAENVHIRIKEIRGQQPSTPVQVYTPYVGGLRVKRIQDFTDAGAIPASSREYEYIKEDGTTTSGTLGVYPEYSYLVFFDERPYHLPPANGVEDYNYTNSPPNSIVRASSPTIISPAINGSPVVYSRVVEKYINNNKNNGKIIRYFRSYEDQYIATQTFPFTPADYKEWNYGLLKKEVILDAQENRLKETENQYRYYLDNTYETNPARLENFKSVSIAPVKYPLNHSVTSPRTNFWNNVMGAPVYQKARYFYPVAGRSDISKTIITQFEAGTELKTEVNYTYDANYNVKTITTKDSKGQQTEENNYYAYDYCHPIAVSMISDYNMYQAPVTNEIWKTIAGVKSLVGGSSIQYDAFASGIQKNSMYTFEGREPVAVSGVAVFDPAVFNRDPLLFEEKIKLNKYTAKGFTEEQFKKNNVINTYLWDYKGQYPIAQVVNAPVNKIAYTSFEADGSGGWQIAPGSTILTQPGITGKKIFTGTLEKTVGAAGNFIVTAWKKNSGSIAVNSQAGQLVKSVGGWQLFKWSLTNTSTITVTGSEIDEVRLYPQGAQITTYTYEPMIGMTSQNDINNRIIYYEYDAFNRLQVVRDQDGNILKRICYNYAGQPEDCVQGTTALWQVTGPTRCQPCPVNSLYTNGIQEHEEKDVNPNSATYNSTRWVADGVSASCLTGVWQATLTEPRCKAGSSTSEQEQEEVDVNPCSPTYNQTRWVAFGTNPSACPNSSCGTCLLNENKKCINGVCELGVKVFLSSRKKTATQWICTFRYEWSDCSYSSTQSEIYNAPCNVTIQCP